MKRSAEIQLLIGDHCFSQLALTLRNTFQVVDVLNPLARDYKSIGTLKKELAELQGELAQAHRQVWKISTSGVEIID